MPKRCKSSFLLFLPIAALICFVFSVEAKSVETVKADPWDKRFFISTGTELITAANAVSQPEKADVVVLLDEASYSFDAEGRCTSRYRLVYRVLTPAGMENWATIEAGWAPWHEERPEFRARVVTPDGIVHHLLPETISDAPMSESSPNLFNDRRVVRAPLPALMIGAVVEQEIVLREKSPFFAAGNVNRFIFGRGVRTLKTRLILEYPVSLPLRHIVQLLPEAPYAMSEENGRKRLVFESGAMEPLKPAEPGMPGDIPRWPNVSLTTGRTWSEVAASYGDTVDHQIDKSDISALVKEVVGDTTERDRIVAKLLARLRKDIRYTGIEFGNSSIIPHTPEETLQNKYGDCKDQAALLIKMLRTAGIAANMALIRTGAGEDVNPDLPGLGNFNHAIVYIPGNPSLWIDPTDSFRPAGELPLCDQGRRALIAGRGFTTLIATPEAPSTENRQVETREFILSELGSSKVNETTWLWGSVGAIYRSNYDRNDDKANRELLEQYARKAYLAEKIAKLEISDPKDLSVPFSIRLEMREANRGYTDDKEALVVIFPAILIERLPSELTQDDKKDTPAIRKHDYLLNEPYVYEVQYRIVPPPGFKLHVLPESGSTSMGPMVLSKKFRQEVDGVVTAVLRFDTGKRRITPAEFEATKKAVKLLQDEKPVYVRFEQTGQSLLAAGKVREALAEFRRLSSLHPKEALHHVQLANALLDLGLRDAARKEAERAIAIEPDSFLSHRTLGRVLQHDSVGRLRQKGYDRSHALAEYRKAKALNPADFITRGDLAILLEFDEEGVRYSRKADMAGAIEEYRAIRSDLKRKDLDKNLMICLFRAERWKELRELAPSLDTPASCNEFLLLAIAAEEGAFAAVKEANLRITDPETRQNALETVASTLVGVRHYQDAAELLEEAAKGRSNAASLRSKSNYFRKIQRFEKVLPADTAPTSVLKRMFLSFFVPESAPDTALSLFARDIRKEVEKESAYIEDSQQRDFFSNLTWDETSELPREVLADFAVSAFEFHIEGSDAAGYRIDAVNSDLFKENKFRLFVVKEDGQYRIQAYGTTPNFIGLEVLRRVGSGDLSGAKTWLDWAREEISSEKKDDPLSEEPFLLIWPKDSLADPERMRLAGACLLSELHGKQVIPLLLKGQDSANEETRRAVNIALMKAYLSKKEYPELLEHCARMEKSNPLSPTLFISRVMALRAVNRWEEVRTLAEARLVKVPKDPFAIRVLALCAIQNTDFELGAKWLKMLVDEGKANAHDYNELAWLGLFRKSDMAESLTFAERAVSLAGGKNRAYLNTLSALYAETGKTAEAREMILKALALNNHKVPTPSDWYVIGRIAESYGEIEAANEAYAKVTEPEVEETAPISTYVLARKRLHKKQ